MRLVGLLSIAVCLATLTGGVRAADSELAIPRAKRVKRSAPSSLPQDLHTSGDHPSVGGLGYVKPPTAESIAVPEESVAAPMSEVSPQGAAPQAAPAELGAARLGDLTPAHAAPLGEKGVGEDKAGRLLSEAYSLYKKQDWRAAAERAGEALRLDNSYEGHMLRAGAHLRFVQEAEGKAAARELSELAAQAEADARAAAEMRPESGSAQFYLAWALFKGGKFNDALEQAKRARQADPTNAQNWFLLAALHDRFGDRKEAVEAIDNAANLDPRFRDRAAEAHSGGKIRYEPNEGRSVKDEFRKVAGWFQTLRDLLGTAAFVALGLLFAVTLGGLGWILGPKAAAPQRRLTVEAPTTPTGALPTGLLAGKYETIRVIGRGGMGDVLEARDQSLGRTVAIKRLSTRLADVGSQGKDLMLQEARTVAALHHPAIVDVFEIIEEGDTLYLVFEFVSGKTVQHMLAEQRKLSLDRTIEILKPVCQALDFAHSRGVVHRDLKPSNIMVTDDGYPKLMDFGIARSMADRIPQEAIEAQAALKGSPGPAGPGASAAPNGLDFVRTRTIVGTPLYMAPEMEQGIVCKESDVYSLGVCVYEMITGDRPFMEPATAFQKMQMDFLKPSLRVPELPGAVDDVITAALQGAPESRLHSTKEFLDRLKAAAKAVQAR